MMISDHRRDNFRKNARLATSIELSQSEQETDKIFNR